MLQSFVFIIVTGNVITVRRDKRVGELTTFYQSRLRNKDLGVFTYYGNNEHGIYNNNKRTEGMALFPHFLDDNHISRRVRVLCTLKNGTNSNLSDIYQVVHKRLTINPSLQLHF